jgi:trigger factor
VSEVVVKIEDLSPIKKKISMEIPWDEVKNELNAVYHDVSKKAKIKGFRPGKIPRKILETYFKDQAENEAATNIINKHYWQALEERAIVPVSKPEIAQEGIKENTNYSFSASFEIEPEFEPKGYKGIEIEKEISKVTDDDVRKRIDEIRQMFATMEEVVEDRNVIRGDFVVIDFTGSMNGEAYDELKSDNYFLEIGSGKFIPGFEDQLIGTKKGETREVKVTLPDKYHENKFAGKDVIFKVTVNNIREKKLPENDESLIKNFEKYNSFDDFQNDVRKSLEEKVEQTDNLSLQNKMTEALLKENNFEAPAALVDRQIYYMMIDTQKRMVSAGIDEQNVMDFTLKMRDKYKDDAEKIVKSFLLIKKIAAKESIIAEEEDIEKYIREIAVHSGRDYETLRKIYDAEDKKESLKMEIIQKKVFDFIENNANIKVVEKTGMNMEA